MYELTGSYAPPLDLHWRYSSWPLWEWCADCGARGFGLHSANSRTINQRSWDWEESGSKVRLWRYLALNLHSGQSFGWPHSEKHLAGMGDGLLSSSRLWLRTSSSAAPPPVPSMRPADDATVWSLPTVPSTQPCFSALHPGNLTFYSHAGVMKFSTKHLARGSVREGRMSCAKHVR